MIVQRPMRDASEPYRDIFIVRNETASNPENEASAVRNEVCSVCGAPALVPAGTCYICRNCGAGTGCS